MADKTTYIRGLKRLLPDIRERLIAVAVLLAVSITMMASATFAWVVLTTKPELKGVSLSISGNGSLEIALVKPDGSQPDASQIGDSVAAGTPIKDANLKWGNLVNVSEGYGLDSLVLRPAKLNPAGLPHGRPLEGVVYGDDGRVEGMQSDYDFTVWQTGAAGGAFVKPDDGVLGYGVRAISSMTYTYEGESALKLKALMDEAVTYNSNARTKYQAITGDSTYMDTIVALIGDVMTWRIDSESYPNPADKDCSDYIVPIVWMLRDMREGFLQHGQALQTLVHVYQFNEGMTESQFISYEDMMAGRLPVGFSTKYTGYDVWLADYNLYKTSLGKLDGCFAYLEDTYGDDYRNIPERQAGMQGYKIDGAYWDQIEKKVINVLVDINACEVENSNKTTRLPVSQIGTKAAINFISGTNKAVITKGLMVDYEHLTGEEMFVPSVKVHVTGVPLIGSATVKANVVTSRSETDELDHFQKNNNAVRSYVAENMQVADAVAGDTFGLVLDLWVRTNAVGSLLTLNGTIITREEIRDVIGMVEGVEYQLYSWTPAEEEQPLQLYNKGTATEPQWYNYETHKQVDVGDETPMLMKETVSVVIEYTGDNRIWDDDQLLIGDGSISTTQGSGSCYIYYADSPEAGAKSLELLKNMKIAFISADNKYLATASMDTEHPLIENGKYTIPLIITDSSCTYTDEEGNVLHGIMRLEQNQATRISAIVYLDGDQLKNEHVLAASDIQGILNLQFKSTAEVEAIEDKNLMDDEINISASFDGNVKNLTFSDYGYPYNKKVNVNLTVDGFTPGTAEAFFQRQISNTQGTRMEAFSIDPATGKGTATFTSPGKYILRYVRLDGAEYELAQPLTVEIEGFAVASVSVGDNYFMTADKSVSTDVSVSFGALDAHQMPRTVQARFITTSGSAINVNLVQGTNGVWTGKVNFTSSGIYRLEHLVLDGVYSQLNANQQQVVEARLGMSAEVIIRRLDENGNPTTNLTFTLENAYNRANCVAYVKVKDDTGKYLENLDTGVTGALRLVYKSNTGLKTLDADLHWDDSYGGYVTDSYQSTQFYVDTPGIYTFSNVLVNGNSINNAYPAPAITAMFPEPPKWSTTQPSDLTEPAFAPNSDATKTIYLTNASTATVKLWFENVSEPVTGVIGEETEDGLTPVTFRLPKGADGTQAGTWKLLSLHISNVSDGRGGVATAEKPYIITLSNPVEMEVTVDDFTLVIEPENMNTEVSGGTFMSTQQMQNMFAWLIQTGGNANNHYAVQGSTLTLTFSHDKNVDTMYAYGGYRPTNGTFAGADVTVTLKYMNDQIYEIDNGGAFAVAGKYNLTGAVLTIPANGSNPERTYTMGATEGGVLGYQGDLPAIHVKSSRPTVKVASVSPTGSITVNTDDEQNGKYTGVSGVTNSKTDYSATVYISWTRSYGSVYNASLPTVTLRLENISDNFTSADMLFAFSTHTSDMQTNRTFSFANSNKESSNSIGYMQSISNGTDRTKSAGKKSVSVITVTATDGTVYTVDLSHEVTINQPQYPYLATVSSTANSGVTLPDEVPGTITAVPNADDEFVLTLPGAITWTETSTDTKIQNEKTISGPTESVYYERWTSGCDTLYQEYTYTVTVREAEEVLTTTGWTHSIIGWKIGDKTYNVGETVIINQDVTVTAVVESTKEEPVVTTNILTTTSTVYYRGKNNQTSPPANAIGELDTTSRNEFDSIIGGWDGGEGTKTVEVPSRTPKS